VADDADHAVDADVAIRRSEVAGATSAHVPGDGEGVGAHLRALLAGVPNPGVGEGVADLGGEGEVVEAADGAAEVLHGDVFGREDQVDPVAMIDGEGLGADGGGDYILHG